MQVQKIGRGVDFPGGTVDKNLPANAGDMSSIPGLGRFHIPWGNYWACVLQLLKLKFLEPVLLEQEKPLQ